MLSELEIEDTIVRQAEVITRLHAEIARLRSALRWYADPKTWLPDFGHDGESPATMDAGEHARNALVEITND